MNATEAGLAAAWVVLNAGGPENSETQINDIMMISKQISTSFSMMSSLGRSENLHEAMYVPAHLCAPGAARFTRKTFKYFKDIAICSGD
jgi:hypothetical protein